jgi:hypothetical protein
MGSSLSFALGHDEGLRLGRPAEQMRLSIPFGDICHELLSQVIQVGEVANTQPLALENAQPLLQLVHPGTMHGQRVAHEAGVSRQPSSCLFASLYARVIEDHPDATNGRWNLPIQLGKQGYELGLPFAPLSPSVDLAGRGIKGGKQVQGSDALVFVFQTHGLPWSSR